MRIDIAMRHIDNPPTSIKEYIQEKLSRLDRYTRLITRIQVVASDEHTHDQNRRYFMEGVAHLPRGREVVAKVSGSCLFEATDALADRLDTQVSRIKDKERDHKSPNHRHRSEQAT